MIHNLKNITVKELFQTDQESFDDYMSLKKLLLMNDDIFSKHKATPLMQLTYGEVGIIKKSVKNITVESIFDIFKLIYKVKLNEFMNADVVDYFYAWKYIEDQIVFIVEKEKKVLASNPDPMMEIAGAGRLQMFGEAATLINLGRSFSLDPKIIEQWTYGFVFMILAYDKTFGEVQKSYNELKRK